MNCLQYKLCSLYCRQFIGQYAREQVFHNNPCYALINTQEVNFESGNGLSGWCGLSDSVHVDPPLPLLCLECFLEQSTLRFSENMFSSMNKYLQLNWLLASLSWWDGALWDHPLSHVKHRSVNEQHSCALVHRVQSNPTELPTQRYSGARMTTAVSSGPRKQQEVCSS